MKFASIPGATYIVVKEGEYIGHQGNTLDYVYYLLEGSSKGIVTTQTGQEFIINTRDVNSKNKLINVFSAFCEPPVLVPCDTIAVEDCRCLRIPMQEFKNYLKTDPELLLSLLEELMELYNVLLYQFQFRQETNAPSAVCAHLVANVHKYENSSFVAKEISKTSYISQLLGIHVVTVSKILSALKNLEIITKEDGCIVVLDLDKLQQYANKEKKLVY